LSRHPQEAGFTFRLTAVPLFGVGSPFGHLAAERAACF